MEDDEDELAEEILHSPMTVRELLAALKNIKPSFVIVRGPDAQSLMIVDPRPGFCLPGEDDAETPLDFSEPDRQFLHKLHIK